MRVIGFSRYGIDVYLPIEIVEGIYPEETVYRYPELSDRLFGLVFLNGEVIPVVDIRSVVAQEFVFASIDSYVNRCSLVVAESQNCAMAFVYDSLKDIVDRENLEGVSNLTREGIKNITEGGAFFVENVELLEDIISGVKTDRNRFQEIFLCPEKY